MQPCSARSCGWQTDTGEVPLPCVHVKLLCLFQVVVGSWLDLFRSVYCDQVAPSGGECRPDRADATFGLTSKSYGLPVSVGSYR